MTQPGHQQGHIPTESYGIPPPVQNFAAPSHHLSAEQSRDIVALAEAGHQDTQGGFMGQTTGSGLTGASGTGFGSNRTEGLANTLGTERRGDDLTGNSGSHMPGMGSDKGVYSEGIGSMGDSNKRGGLSAVEAKQHHGKGGELTDHDFKNTAPEGTLEHKLQDELERNARKAGTHATGFGVQGTPAGSASLGSGTHSGLTGNTSSTSTYAAPLAGATGVGAVGTGAGYGATHGGLAGHGQQGYSSADPAAPHSGGHLADQLHGLGTQQPTEVGQFGIMQDHKRSNNEAAHLPSGTTGTHHNQL